MKKLMIAALVALAAVAGCAPPGARPEPRAAPPAPSAPPAIRWGACPAPAAGVPTSPALTCGTIRVPLDHRRPDGPRITLAVSRLAAGDPAKRRGALLLNPGGPGTEGLHLPATFAQLTSPRVRAAYDLIGFDPRGVGRSTPVTCGLTTAEMVPTSPYPAPDGSIDANIAFARSAAARCRARSGALLPYLTTANTARDLDLIRRALGEERVSYWGGSYGSYLGAVYASLFAGRTDRMVLDSAVDPERIWYDEFRQQSAGMAARFPDAARAAGLSVAEATALYQGVAAALDRAPARVPGSPVVFSGDVFRYLTFSLLYQDAALGPLAQAWRAGRHLAAGVASTEETALLAQILAKITPSATTSPGVPADNAIASAYAVACGDVRWPTTLDTYRRAVARDRAAYPLSAGFPANLWPCAFWPTPPIEAPVRIADHGPRILVLQNERDPATPLESARGMRRALGERSRLVTVAAGGHGVYGVRGPDACENVVADAYLLDGSWPTKDVRCS
ncbi:alpha/beta hydrolase [Cryptosporangium arvum]|uniref:TAP-like protein n=1 Tax=Cryptosporangium arvum DSM 44712 TaxID=927661 RepID=A0A010ZVH2_9ACTN|nr:alpha/beta hydrolase [Cryptosporangium arvum]EXG81202.1 TAP-like protein [Cryptosporangium arvum DSM 44712]